MQEHHYHHDTHTCPCNNCRAARIRSLNRLNRRVAQQKAEAERKSSPEPDLDDR